ncbi:MAG: NAD(+)/NADH kinase, partial [Alistipes sp.]|nr:NAD(+)/NADH kinase [Alistipes sp.]
FDYAVNEEFAAVLRQEADWVIPAQNCYGAQLGPQPAEAVMVCYGGDGTLLAGVHRMGEERIPVVGINAGHLGFLTGDSHHEVERIFEAIQAGTLRYEERTMLKVEGDFVRTPSSSLALNEFSIQRNGAGVLSIEAWVDGQMVATYLGDGVIVSTPTGSTAYSLSAGGPVVAPSCACFVISPLAPHNLTMRPVVIPDSSVVKLKLRIRHAEAFVTLDDRSYPILQDGQFTIQRAERPIFLAVPHNISFYDTLRNKMMWGMDIRG